MSRNTAEVLGEWLVYIGVSGAVGLLLWKLEWSTILWVVGGLLVAGVAIRFTVNRSE